MSVYRDTGVAIARIMSIEANDGTAKQQWQQRYEAGFPELRAANPYPLTPQERMTQDAMTRARLHRELQPLHWHALVAKYSIREAEVVESVLWLIPRVKTPAHALFRTKCVTAWAIPRKPGVQEGTKTSRRALPAAFYLLHTWDNEGTPEGTLRRWRSVTRRWLEDQVTEAYRAADSILQANGLTVDSAA
ncbi:hypothetical protein [Pseudomonas sp. RIT-PI-AD]|uniref:hypothetical protein n=1 Tax=Pseudomonas sp. RIT-PI-AD TaxID=3035294 RepID=UPI0021DAC75D|nr:hypothetical protein [Pseudomonas sp. RIT-PI-AD]